KPPAPKPPIASIPHRMYWHDDFTRRALGRFLTSLVPGRAYPPGTLLSEAERVETARARMLDAPWLLALSPDGAVLGTLAFERESADERAHVRRVHLDVAPASQRLGI